MVVDALGGEIWELLLLAMLDAAPFAFSRRCMHVCAHHLQIKLPVTFLFKDTYSEKIR